MTAKTILTYVYVVPLTSLRKAQPRSRISRSTYSDTPSLTGDCCEFPPTLKAAQTER